MERSSENAARERKIKEGELEGWKDRKNALEFELSELRQTRQDTTAADEKLATVVAEISALEAELKKL